MQKLQILCSAQPSMLIYQVQPGKIQQEARKKSQKKVFSDLKIPLWRRKRKPKKYKQQIITLTTAVFQQVDRFYSFERVS